MGSWGLRNIIGSHYHNLKGWRTNRKIVVFESDDWGSIRMPSRIIFENLKNLGYPVHQKPFESYDSLECEEDLELLFHLIRKYQDKKGQHPTFTVNYIMTNPDFEKIEHSKYREYHYETFVETLSKYSGSKRVFEILMNGINEDLFYPQLHGLTHFNILQWLLSLQNHDLDTIRAFENRMVGITSKKDPESGNKLMIALSSISKEQIEEQIKDIRNSCILFENIFGYRSKSFIAPVYTWNRVIEKTLLEEDIEYLQGSQYQLEPLIEENGKINKVKHHLGKRNELGQIYLIRNSYFEPSADCTRDWVNETLYKIKTAFFWNKPAIISSHRLNYIGRIQPENRDKNLRLLDELIHKILKFWPDIEFLNSVELGETIKQNLINDNRYS